jgi:cytochrome c oxidase assembly factor CtaG
MVSATMPSLALAHDGRPLAPHDLWTAWDWNPAVVIPLVIVAILYFVGVRRVWSRSSVGRGVRVWEMACFASGWIALSVALVSPLHALGAVLFSAHMTQHELIMIVAAPLLVVGRPLVAYVWCAPRTWRRPFHAWSRRSSVRRSWELLTAPAVASAMHAAAIAVWHLPSPYQATLTSDVAHALQHFCFLASALLFWWAMIRPRRATYMQSVIYLFVTTLWTGALGALLAFAPNLWYPEYAATTGLWGLTPLEDQQLGGIIMWIPGGGSYLIAALALCAAWLRDSERRGGRPAAGLAIAVGRSA